LRLSLVDREKVDPEVFLKLSELEKTIQDDVRVFALLELDHDAHTRTIGLVAKIGNAFNFFIANEIRDLFDELRLVDLIGELRNDDSLALAFERLDFGLRAHGDG